MLNQALFEDPEMSTQMGFYSFPPPSLSFPPLGCHQSLKAFTNINAPLSDDAPSNLSHETLLTSTSTNQKQDHITSHLDAPQLLSLQRSSANLWASGELNECFSTSKRSGGHHGDADQHHLGISAMKMKKIKTRRKVREPRFCFKTMSDVDVLDDGYKWRKYGQKVVKNTQHPRSYYRCTQDNCRVKKRVERLAEDPRMVITTYEGRHVHSPSQDQLDESQAPYHLNNFFW
uniref:Putative WRKY transcription factor 13 n=1 Tax=Paeonia lactiflora TaxID=35924 RepID=A0A2P0W751_PAELC|nr:putative WRKY transcription factor 13 [Paeonia lactiflora]